MKTKPDQNRNKISPDDILLSSVMDSMFGGIVVSDRLGNIVLHNSKFRELWNISFEFINEKSGREILHYALKQTEMQGKFLRRIRNIWEDESKDFGLINLKDGRILEYFTTPLYDEDQINGFLGIFRDVTEKTRMLIRFEEYTTNLENIVKLRTEQISNLNKQLTDEIEKTKLAERIMRVALEKEKEVSQLKSGFISTASHEFKTPVTTILSSIDLMESYWDQQNKVKFIEHKEKIKSKVHNLIQLIDDVLIIHQIEKNKMEIKNENINLKEVINELLDEIKILDKQNHDIIYNYNTETESIESDPRIYRHVVGNLLSNAVKYTPEEGRIILDVSITESNVKIIVADEGPGIANEYISKIFEPFERGNYHGDKEGSGLGLSIVKFILDLCGGNIEVFTQQDKGTKFFVTIPLGQK